MPYSETLQVPLIWSNPKLWPEGKSTPALVSHVDMIPTLCDIIGADTSKYGLVGVSYKSVLVNESEAVQDYVLYQFEDVWATFDMVNPPLLNAFTRKNLITNISNGILPSPNRLWVMNTGEYTVAINHMVLDVFDSGMSSYKFQAMNHYKLSSSNRRLRFGGKDLCFSLLRIVLSKGYLHLYNRM